MDKICIAYSGRGFGDHLIVAHTVHILNATIKNIQFLASISKWYAYLMDVPLMVDVDPSVVTLAWFISKPNVPIILSRLQRVEDVLGIKIEFNAKELNYVPVKFEENINIPQVDVVLCTKTGPWTPYRNWGFFDQLKQRLNDLKITYVDLNEQKILSYDCLNYVKKCKVYVGLETGTSHYVSRFANGKALIIQGGYSTFDYWSFTYDYKAITSNSPCPLAPCFLRTGCPHNHVCMNIEVDSVLKEILNYL